MANSRAGRGGNSQPRRLHLERGGPSFRGDYNQSEYGKVILPLTVIRRLDCVLEPTKQAVLDKHKQLAGKIENVEPVPQATAPVRYA